ncbi:hypothetical protein P692DRAFT_20883167 [Suillus brevipes Sb2]|nr:hypothetical protein P692DRAFT_20883167 [Suillus brevipes Sb2]
MEQNIHYNTQTLADTLPVVLAPGPLVICDSAITLWIEATETVQCHMNYQTMLPPATIHTTVEEKCWVTLMALQREEELKNALKSLEKAWRELDEVKVLLGIQMN